MPIETVQLTPKQRHTKIKTIYSQAVLRGYAITVGDKEWLKTSTDEQLVEEYEYWTKQITSGKR